MNSMPSGTKQSQSLFYVQLPDNNLILDIKDLLTEVLKRGIIEKVRQGVYMFVA